MAAMNDMPDDVFAVMLPKGGHTDDDRLSSSYSRRPKALTPPLSNSQQNIDDVFGGSLSSLTATSSQGQSNERIIPDDSDSELTSKKSSSVSPPFHDHISNPRLNSSPTPPTSETEVSPAAPVKNKGKERARDVAPLALEEEDISAVKQARPRLKSHTRAKLKGKEKPKKLKVSTSGSLQPQPFGRSFLTLLQPPTKKELQESLLETARLVSDQSVSIPRADKRLSVSSLFKTIKYAS